MKSLFTSTAANKRLWVVVLIFAALLLLMRMMSAPGSAQSPSPQKSAEARNERVFENTIPKDVPIKVKLRATKEESFRDLKNEKWVREFELEVTNTGDKPIYFLFLDLITDVKLGGNPLVFSLVYGRNELGLIATKAASDDVPIKPGDTYVFKIHPGQVPAWEKGVRDESQSDAKRIQLRIEILSFGDGTGFFGNHPYPPASGQKSRLDDRVRQPNKGEPEGLKRPSGRDVRTLRRNCENGMSGKRFGQTVEPADWIPTHPPINSSNCLRAMRTIV
jgi:hypothetical protein